MSIETRTDLSRIPALILVALLAAGCGAPEPAPAEGSPADSPPDSLVEEDTVSEELGGLRLVDVRVTVPWQDGLVTNDPGEAPEPSLVSAISMETIGNFDRVTVQFGSRDLALGYWTELPGEQPRRCSGAAAPELVAEHWLVLRMGPARAGGDDGGLAPVHRREVSDIRNVRGVEVLCESEGALEVAIALTRRSAYRLVDVRNPERIVLDFIH